jgi:transcriptional antiterminator Rof (Rho-off)
MASGLGDTESLQAAEDAMGHIVETCDFIDVLEEAAVLGTEVAIDLRDGGHFTDTVRDVVTEEGQDFATFKNHGRLALHSVANARRATPRVDSYEGKRGQ